MQPPGAAIVLCWPLRRTSAVAAAPRCLVFSRKQQPVYYPCSTHLFRYHAHPPTLHLFALPVGPRRTAAPPPHPSSPPHPVTLHTHPQCMPRAVAHAAGPRALRCAFVGRFGSGAGGRLVLALHCTLWVLLRKLWVLLRPAPCGPHSRGQPACCNLCAHNTAPRPCLTPAHLRPSIVRLLQSARTERPLSPKRARPAATALLASYPPPSQR